MTGQPGIPTNGDVWAWHGHPGQPCNPPDAVHGGAFCRPSTPAPSGGDALTDGEKESILRAHVHISPKALIAAVERILAARAAQPGTPTAVEALADQWNETPDYTASEYDQGRVDQRHAMTEQLLAALAQVETQPSQDATS
jgi:hypothetical protein